MAFITVGLLLGLLVFLAVLVASPAAFAFASFLERRRADNDLRLAERISRPNLLLGSLRVTE